MGLEPDLPHFKNQTLDGYEQFLRQRFNNTLGAVNSARIEISFPSDNGKNACAVRVPRSPTAVYAKAGNDDAFYIRDGNGTRQLTREETVSEREHFR